ncbi:homocitrate synthase [Halolamina sp. CBA1230]|uniref:LeuA family protein n=1 Tax=Halolamina sp. CBA1230 TaxID=1853690 RepID=UPI0009A1742E|nr:homocitrate synthase [Halolamina sp. CBA1230]QKY19136.1 homocitrate synthase [Halolamina sp. CBA1230]
MKLLDLTLREGEQRPGVEYTVDQKVAAARELDELGADFLQIGFPVAGERTRKVCERLDVAADVTGLARAVPGDVEAALDAGVDVVDLFAPTSDRQLDAVLGSSRESMVESVREAAALARAGDADVHLTAMDGFRTDPRHLDDLFAAVDADWYTVADTVGSRTPAGVQQFLADLDTDLGSVGVHFHEDLGVGTANALAAGRVGAGKVDVSVGGIGERAGNTATEEFVAAAAVGVEPIDLAVDEPSLLPVARRVLETLDEDVSPTKPLLGDEVFSHESGLHTAAMLDEPSTFEPFDPARFGGERRLLFGASTGAGAARTLLERAGREPTEARVEALLSRLAELDEEVGVDEAVEMAGDVAA